MPMPASVPEWHGGNKGILFFARMRAANDCVIAGTTYMHTTHLAILTYKSKTRFIAIRSTT